MTTAARSSIFHPRFVFATAIAACLALSPLQTVAQEAPQHDAVKPVSRGGGWMNRHNSINARAARGNVDLVFVGDSITQGWEGNGRDVWAKYYGPRNTLNAGISGDRTQHVLWRFDNGNIDGISPKLAVVMIGTNNARDNTPEEIADGIRAVVAKLRAKLPETKVLLLAVFPRGADVDDELRNKNAAANQLARKAADGQMVHYLDVGDRFLADNGRLSTDIMPDLLHLSPRGYQIWAESIEESVAKLMSEK